MIILRPLLRRIGFPPTRVMSFTFPIAHVFQYSGPEETPASYLQKLCDGAPNALSENRAYELSNCKVVLLELYKNTKGVQHEFVLAHITHSSTDESGLVQTQTRIIVLERSVDTPTTLSQSSLIVSDSADSGVPAKDTITAHQSIDTVLVGDKSSAVCCYQVTFTGDEQPTILDLVVAANTLSVLAKFYTVFKHMCYWFGNSLCRLLAHERCYSVILCNRSVRAGYYKITPILNAQGRILLREPTLSELSKAHSDIFCPPQTHPPTPDPFYVRDKFTSSDLIEGYYATFQTNRQKADARLESLEGEHESTVRERDRAVRERDQEREEKRKAVEKEKKAVERAEKAVERAEKAEKKTAELEQMMAKLMADNSKK
ncbi:hypothetical protein QCA50_006172 [Cerrena zonata]|uniref:Uncharacterized protein n=1 Tax=Cerrena zonata TaxID=2478898 RepID=A0AAW0GIT9_9APHY